MDRLEVTAVIPARYASTRFPGKPLALISGRPMIEHVWRRCRESGAFRRVIVATDDARIADAATGFGAEAWLTSARCESGTDRVAEVARALPGAELFVNVQGDEPAVHPDSLRALVEALRPDGVQMATLVRPLAPPELDNPNVVKVVLSASDQALYFSRSAIPHQRDPGPPPQRWAHVGLYGYRRAALLRLSGLPPSPLEKAERLEQLRALENGLPIHCGRTTHAGVGVDVPEDVPRAEALLSRLLP